MRAMPLRPWRFGSVRQGTGLTGSAKPRTVWLNRSGVPDAINLLAAGRFVRDLALDRDHNQSIIDGLLFSTKRCACPNDPSKPDDETREIEMSLGRNDRTGRTYL